MSTIDKRTSTVIPDPIVKNPKIIVCANDPGPSTGGE